MLSLETLVFLQPACSAKLFQQLLDKEEKSKWNTLLCCVFPVFWHLCSLQILPYSASPLLKELLFQCISVTVLGLKQLHRSADFTGVQGCKLCAKASPWVELGRLWKKNQNTVLICYYQPSELKSLQRAGKKVLRISTHRSACSELGGMLKIYKHQKWTKALFKTDVSLGMHQAKSSDCIQPVGLDPQNWKHLMHVLWVFIMSFGHVTSIFSS